MMGKKILTILRSKCLLILTYGCINKGSNMSTHVLLNLLKELRKRDKMQGIRSILLLFHNKFNYITGVFYIKNRLS